MSSEGRFTVALVEPHWRGHHSTYPAALIDAFGEQGWACVLVSSDEALRSRKPLSARWPELLTVSGGGRPPVPASGSAVAMLRYQISYWRYLRNLFNPWRLAIDVVYCVNFDDFDKACALLGSPFGPVPVHGMLMHPRFHHARVGVNGPKSRSDSLYTLMFRKLLGDDKIATVFAIDETLAGYARTHCGALANKVHYVPDPVVLQVPTDSEEAARRRLGIPDDAFIVLLFGALSARKGLETAIEACLRLSADTPIHLVVAGSPDASAEAILGNASANQLRVAGRMTELLAYVDEATERDLYDIADLVWVAYENFWSMSGVMLTAHAFGKPVLGNDIGLVGAFLRKHRCGLLIQGSSLVQTEQQLRWAMQNPDSLTAIGGRGKGAVQGHTPAQFCSVIVKRIAESAGVPSASGAE